MSTKAPTRNKPRLGRGLSSLISISEVPVQVELPPAPQPESVPARHAPAAAPQAAPVEPPAPIISHEPLHLPIGSILPNPHQPRQHFDEQSLAELAASIRTTGLIQPIIVRKAGEQYELIAGERRLRAGKLAQLATIPALVRDVDAATQAQMALIENIQREDLNPIDRALGYRTLLDQLGLTQAELAGRLGEERSSIANFLRLLDLAEPVKAMVRDARLTLGHAKLIAGIDDILEQERLAKQVVEHGLTVRNLERLIQEGPKVKVARPETPAPSAHLIDLEKNMARQLGLRVQIRAAARKGRGKLILHYASLEQFDELLGRLGCQVEA